jgi:hypothetical protein
MSCWTRRRTSSTTCGGELDDVERVEDGAGVFELVIDGVLVPVERVQRGDLHCLSGRRLPRSVSQVR